ncbi:MAG: hypothetical protein WCB79_06340 [Halobacteriota archaeon]|jgi:hypothetical protein
MATKELTRLERDMAIIEQALRLMIEITPGEAQILSKNFQQSEGGMIEITPGEAQILSKNFQQSEVGATRLR